MGDLQGQLLRDIKHWLNPPMFAEDFERACRTRHEGTSDWLLEADAYTQWHQSFGNATTQGDSKAISSNALWISGKRLSKADEGLPLNTAGNPGCGKTILASAIIEDLRAEYQGTVTYYFFRSGIPPLDLGSTAFRAILAQILWINQDNDQLIDAFSLIMNKGSSGQMFATSKEMSDLFRLSQTLLGEIVVVIDAIDECKNLSEFIAELLLISKEPQVRLCIFGRPNIEDRLFALRKTTVAIGQSNTDDIRKYLFTQLDGLVAAGLFGSKNVDRDELADRLTIGANGMFLWAHLSILYLQIRSLTPARRLRVIHDIVTPEDLHNMYDRIIGLILTGSSSDQALARYTSIWLCAQKRELCISEMRSAVAMADSEFEIDADHHDDDFARAVISACSGLVEIGTITGDRKCFRFIHLSVREYFLGVDRRDHASRSSRQVLIQQGEICPHVVGICLEAFDCQQDTTHGSTEAGGIASQKSSRIAFHQYAASCWVLHLLDTLPAIREGNRPSNTDSAAVTRALEMVLKSISSFLLRPFAIMTCIEASYKEAIVPDHPSISSWAAGAITAPAISSDPQRSQLAKNVSGLAKYLSRLDTEWSAHLFENPASIWDEITAFSPSQYVAQTTGTKIDYIQSKALKRADISSNVFSEISETSAGGSLMAVLSIWTSR